MNNSKTNRRYAERLILTVVAGVMVAFLATPILALFVRTTATEFHAGVRHPLVWPALRLSLMTTSTSLVLVVLFGTPLAWLLAKGQAAPRRSWIVGAIETMVQLPIVIPPAVAGVAMLFTFGRRGLFASSVAFTTWAVVMAEVFVSAPFFIQAATSAFRRVDPKLILVARSFGASPFRVLFRIAIPLAAPGLLAGAAMSWARSLGEFGATLMFAGNLEGQTQTLPLAIYTTLESDIRAAQALSIILVVVAFVLLMFVHAALKRADSQREGLS